MGVLLREAGAAALSQQASVSQLAQIAIIAFPKFPDLTRELTQQALRIYREKQKNKFNYGMISGEQDDAQNLGIALSLFDKTAAREFLEFAWLDILEDTKRESQSGWNLPGVAYAMAFVDFERALQMARAMPQGEKRYENYSQQTLSGLAQWVSTSPEKRVMLWNSFRIGLDDD